MLVAWPRIAPTLSCPPGLIEVHVEQIEQLFNSIDPSPFHARDLDPQADEYIVACARDLPRDLSLAGHPTSTA